MLPSTTITTDDTTVLPRLTVRELRAVQHGHQLDTTYHAASGDTGGREWRGQCSCGVALLPHRWRAGVVEAHALHVSAAAFDARRAKAARKGTCRVAGCAEPVDSVRVHNTRALFDRTAEHSPERARAWRAYDRATLCPEHRDQVDHDDALAAFAESLRDEPTGGAR